jgi:GTPase SAR1 family protein
MYAQHHCWFANIHPQTSNRAELYINATPLSRTVLFPLIFLPSTGLYSPSIKSLFQQIRLYAAWYDTPFMLATRMSCSLERPALGRAAKLGELYDARSDLFVNQSLLSRPAPPSAITRMDIPNSDIKHCRQETYSEKFENFGIGPELGASILAGLWKAEGTGRYLKAKRQSNLIVQNSLVFDVATVSESINYQAEELEGCLSLDNLDNCGATHVVAGIDWGSRNIVMVKQSLSKDDEVQAAAAQLESQISFFRGAVKQSISGDFAKANESHAFDNSFEVTILGDVVANDGLLPTDLSSAAEFIRNVPKYVATANSGKGKPQKYKLQSLSELSSRLKVQIARQVTVRELSSGCAEKFVQAFDGISSIRQNLGGYMALLQAHKDYISQSYLRSVDGRILEIRAIESRLESDYGEKLKDVRAGISNESALQKILDDFNRAESAIHRLAAIDPRPTKEKIQLISGLVAKGAKYIGFNGDSLDLELGSTPNEDIYVFQFSEEARRNSESWKQNVTILHQLLADQSQQGRVILKDCDAVEESLATPRVSLYRNAKVISEDVLENRRRSASTCIAKYSNSHLDRSGAPKPLSRIALRIPCPGRDCSITASHDWFCTKCGGQNEYGVIDQYIYCDCGRCEYRHWAFRCSSCKHGLEFSKFDEARLLKLLLALEPFEELNILILGRTGVGKSTWINALANYLTYPSLDDALQADKLSWIIPFAFRTHKLNDEGKFESVKIKVGFDDDSGAKKVSVDEHDGTTGRSATQKTIVHRVQIGKRLIRLIDTPGIGDTRGASQDKQNMADILSVLRSYPKLHGILILMMPNEQKLDVMFKFCVQELLTHLHRDAAKNIAFGFTNTRGTNYMPADTFDPLNELLNQYKEVDIALRKHNVYCFDSESFRYLAAQKLHGSSLGPLEENRNSWEYSVAESKRLLDYFKGLEPHEVTSTVNLYETRFRIFLMTEPLAKIAENIKCSITLNEREIKELSDHDLKKQDLERFRRVRVKVTEPITVDMPRTTCSHPDCVTHVNTGIEGMDGLQILRTAFTRLCHSPCYLDGIKLDDIGNVGLKGCWAMNGTDTCRECKHHWISHLHVLYELRERTMEIDNPETVEKLKRHATKREEKETSIAARRELIEELELELDKVRVAAAQFSIFLKRNAIMPYNDATIDYLDRLIEQERGIVNSGGSRDNLNVLEQYRKQYEQEVQTLDKYFKKGEESRLLDQAGIEDCVRKLHSLKRYGESLRNAGKVVFASQAAVHREKPYVMRARPHFTGEEAGHETVRVDHREKQEQKGWIRRRWRWVTEAVGLW